MKSMILGTAGHIDHGKTCLIKALTGINTDRLEEEKKRGISIDLGFAHCTLPSGQKLGVVDVPGHERFVRNMLAGASGIDFVLLAVAADDGVMPQTEEHLAIVDLLGIKEGVVAITKTDLVEEEWVGLVEDDIKRALAKTSLAGAPIVPVSAISGTGLDKLKIELDNLAGQVAPRVDKSAFRLPVDRVFSIAGAGTVVTGTLWSGEIKMDQWVHIYPADKKARVRRVQVHGDETETAVAGQRVALNLAGIARGDIRRGDVILEPDYLSPSYMLDVRFKLLANAKELKSKTRIRIHHGTNEVLGRVILFDRTVLRPGETAYAQLRLERPVVVKYGDCFVVRSYSPIRTTGGGRVLDSHPIKHRQSEKGLIDRFKILNSGDAQSIVKLILQESCVAMSHGDLVKRAELGKEEIAVSLRDLSDSGELVQLSIDNEKHFLPAESVLEKERRLVEHLLEYGKKNPLKPAVVKTEVKSSFFPRVPDKEFDALLNYFDNKGAVTVKRGAVAHPQAQVSIGDEERRVMDRMTQRISAGGYKPPEIDKLADTMGLSEAEATQMADYLAKENKVVRVTPKLYFEAKAIDMAVEKLKTQFTDKEITPSEFRQLLGTSRKYAIPLLNYLDVSGVTKRVGDVRVLR